MVFISAVLTCVIYVNHIFIIKKIKENKPALGNLILNVILIFITCWIVYTICSMY